MPLIYGCISPLERRGEGVEALGGTPPSLAPTPSFSAACRGASFGRQLWAAHGPSPTRATPQGRTLIAGPSTQGPASTVTEGAKAPA